MEYSTAFVNAFANGLFDGNTAAVVIVDKYPSDNEMVSVAGLFGFSETAFLLPLVQAKYQIRWFTPETEVPLCGHATLASAGFLFSEREKNEELISFSSLSGELTARRRGDELELDFPLDIPQPYVPDREVLNAMGKLKIRQTLIAKTTSNLILVQESPEDVMAVQPDFKALAAIMDQPYFGVAVTAVTKDGYICRYFAPWEGINEDPVTGSAQTFLAPYWAGVLGKNKLKGFQASERGGKFNVTVLDGRLLLRGKVVIYLRGVLNLE